MLDWWDSYLSRLLTCREEFGRVLMQLHISEIDQTETQHMMLKPGDREVACISVCLLSFCTVCFCLFFFLLVYCCSGWCDSICFHSTISAQVCDYTAVQACQPMKLWTRDTESMCSACSYGSSKDSQKTFAWQSTNTSHPARTYTIYQQARQLPLHCWHYLQRITSTMMLWQLPIILALLCCK